MNTEQRERVRAVNLLIEQIASCGRRFFRYDCRSESLGSDDPRRRYVHAKTGECWCVSHLELDERGRVWFVDGYAGARIYTHYNGHWRGFTNGGTLRQLVECLRDWIKHGDPMPAWQLVPWPDYLCGGDLWGYGDDMERVRERARTLGISGT